MSFTRRVSIASAVVALVALGGCMEDTSSVQTAIREGSKVDEDACLAAVAKTTNNTVAVISSVNSEANTTVMVGVGPEKARWRCLVSGGKVAQVMSMVDEGAL